MSAAALQPVFTTHPTKMLQNFFTMGAGERLSRPGFTRSLAAQTVNQGFLRTAAAAKVAVAVASAAPAAVPVTAATAAAVPAVPTVPVAAAAVPAVPVTAAAVPVAAAVSCACIGTQTTVGMHTHASALLYRIMLFLCIKEG